MKVLGSLALLLLCAPVRAEDPAPVKGTTVLLAKPAGFEQAAGFAGYANETEGASLMVTEIPGPASQVMKTFTKEQLATKGIVQLSTEEVKFGETPGRLIYGEQRAQGILFKKWMGLLGDESRIVIVMGTFPKENESKVSTLLKDAVLSARLSERKELTAADLPFELSEAGELKTVKFMSGGLVMSAAGVFPSKDPAHSGLIATVAGAQNVVESSRTTYAEATFKQLKAFKDQVVTSSEPIVLDGLKGVKTLGTAVDESGGPKLVIYQVMLFDESQIFIINARTAETNAANYLPLFEQVAKSFKVKG